MFKKTTIAQANSTFNTNPVDPFYYIYCANSNDPSTFTFDWLNSVSQLPQCGQEDATLKLRTDCCNINNCNQVIVPDVVSSCLVGGHGSAYPFKKPISQATMSPYNKYCNVRNELFIINIQILIWNSQADIFYCRFNFKLI